MGLQADAYQDILVNTLKELGRLKFTDLSYDLQEHVIMPTLLKKEKVKFDSGYGINWQVLVDHNHSARNVGLFAVDNINVRDGLRTATVPWRHTTADYAYERRLMAMNREPAKILDYVKSQRHMAMVSLAAHMEQAGWSAPPADTDEDMPYGIPFWIQKYGSSGVTTAGFNGTNPSGFTGGAGGISSTTHPRWANWTEQYTAVTKADLIKKLREATTKTGFKPPVDHASYARGKARRGLYTNYNVISAMEEVGEAQNENLGRDLASMDGQIMFRRTPVTYVPHLDSDTDDPIYGIDWSEFSFVFLKGEYLREDPPEKAPEQHTVYKGHIDLTWNTRCTNRRRQFCLSK